MARNLNALVLALLAAATLFHGSAAQTRHVVGDSTGWAIPSGGASFYSNWAANKTFTVGDTLVFNFANGQHNVAKLTKSAFDSCSGASPISVISTSPATVTLNETGEQHFICTVGGHCSLGQKLAVNVVAKASNNTPSPVPAPKPSPVPAPKPSPVPAPAPSTTTPPPTSATPPSSAATPPSSAATPPSSSPSSDVNPSSPSPTSAVSPPPKDSAAVSLGAAGFFASTAVSIAAVFFF